MLQLPKRNGTREKVKNQFAPKSKVKATFEKGHQFHIHSLSASADGENFLSADEVSVNLWNLEHNK